MQQSIDDLNTYFKNKRSFYDSLKNILPTNITKKPYELINKLNKLGYVFTQQDFNCFVTNITYQKKNGYLNYCDKNDTYYDWKNTIQIMFEKFVPTANQFNLLISCYNLHSSYCKFHWIDMLVKTKYLFTNEQKSQMFSSGYDMCKLYATAQIQMEDFKQIIISVINTQCPINVLKDIVDKHNLTYPDDFIEWLFAYCPTDNQFGQLYTVFTSVVDLLFSKNIIKITDELNNFIIDKKLQHNMIYYFFSKGLRGNYKLMEYCSLVKDCGIHVFRINKQSNIDITPEIIDNLLKRQNFKYSNSIAPYLISFGYDPTFANLCNVYVPHNNNIINMAELIIHLNILPTTHTFNYSCETHNQKLFDYCTKTHKMLPSKEHLKLAISHVTDTTNDYLQLIQNILCYKIIPDSDCLLFDKLSKPTIKQDIVELLIKFGFSPTLKDITIMMSQKINISKLERFDIKYDETLYYYSHIYNNWYYDNKIKLKNDNVLELRKLCRTATTTVDMLQQYIANHNVNLDRYCFEHACRYNSTLTAYMLNKLRCEPTIGSIYWSNPVKNDVSDLVYHQLLNIHKIDDAYLSTELK